MGITVHDAKRARTNLEEALESAAAFLARHPDQATLAASAGSIAQRLAAATVEGREADPADAGTVALLNDAVAIGNDVLTQSDAGRKVPRLTSRIEDAAKVLAAG
jgi:hypothetical protein